MMFLASFADKNLEAILAILTAWVVPVAIVAVAAYFAHRRNRLAHETIRLMIEKGLPVTPETIAALRRRPIASNDRIPQTRKDLRVGVILLCVGIGLLRVQEYAGFILIGLGSAYLLLYFLDRSHPPRLAPPAESPAPTQTPPSNRGVSVEE